MSLALDPVETSVRIMVTTGLQPDPWQLQVLHGNYARLLLNCSRQAGKSTVVAVHALTQVMCKKDLLVLLLSRSQRQSTELFAVVRRFYERLNMPGRRRLTGQELSLNNNSRVVSLPCREDTIRGFARVGLLIIDEAARVPDDLYRAVRPMLAVSRGRLICMSTPFGKRGFFYEAWAHGGDDWERIEVPASQVPRISAEFLEQERRCLGNSYFRQEYQCSFEALQGLVFPELAQCLVSALPETVAVAAAALLPGAERVARETKDQRVGGLDFGFRNPFAAVWGLLDSAGVLWLVGEHYCRKRPLSYHAARLPPGIMWYADPAGANERAELQSAGFKVRQANNALRPGIAAVTARIQSGRLRIREGACPNLLAEADLYRYSDDPREKYAEVPVDEHNHALAALRYLVTGIDYRRQARVTPVGRATKAVEPDELSDETEHTLWTP